MAENKEDFGEKTEEPSLYRIEEFRRKGEVASSKELINVLVLSATVFTLGLSIVFIFETLHEYVTYLYSLEPTKSYSESALKAILSRTVSTALYCVAPIFIVSACVGVLSNVMQIGFLFSPEVLELKWERLNPIAGAKRLISIRSLVEALKGIFKFTIVISIVYYFISDQLGSYQGFLHMTTMGAFIHGRNILMQMALSLVLGMVLVALGDFAYQKMSYRKKLMMTKDEVKRETKEKEGNPEVKQRIRTIQREMAQRRMMADVPTADAIITNPTHLSVAIRYNAENMVSPQVIAKGGDHMAMRIREIARQHHIPIVENIPLARSLYKTVKLGESVPTAMYKAVAEILAFAYKLKRKEQAVSLG
ncbi:MAG: flagellar biosynthesis protein FlhB [Bdellovibrionales bacterium]|jgi:flagellar biosynthesis protein FlhB|nr:flagellar biosynthesis protein FlhB [Bdellovibrionales bacterium]MBT3527261.1 flagellar biosynthesis protein FlhB [Bdellovibrionales bacterium]MBT7668412.1 flagellar biosynthesis protein FlhB [Bdellovibrionales bacterium]MBT7767162.1 flagellar biosynthesis protein FlhB [Bdellovibrionales bacterium]